MLFHISAAAGADEQSGTGVSQEDWASFVDLTFVPAISATNLTIPTDPFLFSMASSPIKHIKEKVETDSIKEE